MEKTKLSLNRAVFLFLLSLFSISLVGCLAHDPASARPDLSLASPHKSTHYVDTAGKERPVRTEKKDPEEKNSLQEGDQLAKRATKEKPHKSRQVLAAQREKGPETKRETSRSTSKKQLLSPMPHKVLTPPSQDQGINDKEGVPEEGNGKGEIILNFDDADLSEVIMTVADMLDINYIMEPGINGKVSIHTSGSLNREDLFPIFFQILDLNGLTAIRHGKTYNIVRLKGAGTRAVQPRYGKKAEELANIPGEKVVIQIVPLQYISAAEMTKVLHPFISPSGTILSHKGSNTLVIADKAANILKALRIVNAFDISMLDQVRYRFFTIRNLEVKEASNILKDVFSSSSLSGSKAEIKFIPLETLNMVLAIGPDEHVLDKIQKFVNKLNKDMGGVEPRIFVYFVKNGKAEQLSELLNQVFVSESRSKKKKEPYSDTQSRELNPFARKKKSGRKKGAEGSESSSTLQGGTGSNTLQGEVRITPDPDRNALIIEATPGDYAVIKNILNQLDVLPRQVLIECTIAEITLDSQTDLGIEWSYTKGERVGVGTLASTIGSGGLTYTVGIANKIKADLSAFAKEGRVNLLSSPHVLASDNKEAKIDISNEIPVASSSYQYTNESDVISTSIEYRDTGVILSVTPHINSNGIVTMDIDQEVSKQAEDVAVAGKTYPSFAKRHLTTTLTVKHGQTIVLGGLISTTNSNTEMGTPWIVDIPVLRYLFGREVRKKNKSELIVLLTPRVVTSLNDVDMVTEEFKNKVQHATGMLYMKKSSSFNGR